MRPERRPLGARQHRRGRVEARKSDSSWPKQCAGGNCAAGVEIQATEGKEGQTELCSGNTRNAGEAEREAAQDEHGCSSAIRRLLGLEKGCVARKQDGLGWTARERINWRAFCI